MKEQNLMIVFWNWYYMLWCLPRYDKLQKGHKTEDEKQLQAPSQTGKYVILDDEMDDQENGP